MAIEFKYQRFFTHLL